MKILEEQNLDPIPRLKKHNDLLRCKSRDEI